MRTKWLELAHGRSKQDPPNGRGSGISDPSSNEKNENETRALEVAPPTEKNPVILAGERVPAFRAELLPIEDIYRAAGIMDPRKGYSIIKVVEILRSEHIRGLSQEMKRAALLMALDAAGIPIDEVVRDAKTRQDALDSYEADQRKQLEAECARREEENARIQGELERAKAHYATLLTRLSEGMARQKAAFSNWLTTKQQEYQSISEAAELCLKSVVPERASGSPRDVDTADSSNKSV